MRLCCERKSSISENIPPIIRSHPPEDQQQLHHVFNLGQVSARRILCRLVIVKKPRSPIATIHQPYGTGLTETGLQDHTDGASRRLTQLHR
jgi:hypothetical protein